jgi:nicotinamide-nucleotide amidase
MMDASLYSAAEALLARCRLADLKIATAESCTGGLIIATLTDIAGSSDVVDRGFVTYSNAAKSEMLGVSPQLITRVGAVSPEVAIAMVEGAIARSAADIAVAVTGIAGPGGGSVGKPVGLVQFAGLRRGRNVVQLEQRFGAIGRSEVRWRTVEEALLILGGLLAE